MYQPNIHVVHVIDELKVGGAQSNLISLLRATSTRPGLRQSVVCLFGEGQLRKEIEDLGFQVTTFDFSKNVRRGNLFSGIFSLASLFRKIGPSHVLCHLTWSRFIGLPAGWLAGVPFRFGYEHGDIYLRSLFIKLGNFVSQYFAIKIFVCSRALGEWFQNQQLVFKKRVEVIYYGVDLDRILGNNSSENLRGEWGFSENTLLFCCVGTMGSGVNKRFDICLRAIAETRSNGLDVGLILCGDGELRPELENLARELKIEKYVRFLGLRRDVLRVMKNCQSFCHATPFEAFGLVIVEAMLMELPVIVPDKGGPSEIVDDQISGIQYETLNFQDLSRKMAFLVQNKELRHDIAKRGKAKAIETYDINRYASEILKAMGI